jgi:hypothetical protein
MVEQFDTVHAERHIQNADPSTTGASVQDPVVSDCRFMRKCPRTIQDYLVVLGTIWGRQLALVKSLCDQGLKIGGTPGNTGPSRQPSADSRKDRIPKRARTEDIDPIDKCTFCGKSGHAAGVCRSATYHPHGNKEANTTFSESKVGRALYAKFGIKVLPAAHDPYTGQPLPRDRLADFVAPVTAPLIPAGDKNKSRDRASTGGRDNSSWMPVGGHGNRGGGGRGGGSHGGRGGGGHGGRGHYHDTHGRGGGRGEKTRESNTNN